MANESHTLRIGIDANAAKRGSQAYVAAINRIAQATRDFQNLQGQLGKAVSRGGSFANVARDLQKLNGLRLNPSIAKNVQQLSTAISSFRGPSNASLKNFRSFAREVGAMRLSPGTVKGLAAFTSAMAGFKGPSRSAVANTQNLLRVLALGRVNPATASAIAQVSNALNNFKGPSSGAARSVQALSAALAQMRVPAGIGRLGAALSGLGGRFHSTSGAALRLGGSVNSIPWGRASAGAIQLTGNLRGLENAMSLSYQMGSQLRVLFGALTLSGFTSGVMEATMAATRLQNVMTALADGPEQVTQQLEYASQVSRKYGLDLLSVQKDLGRFTAATMSAGLTLEQSNFMFESLGRQARLFGLDTQSMGRAMLGITQMFQKGSIRMEEFRNQLGEQLPVYQAMVKVVAELKGIDPSEVDLNKMAEEGQLDPRLIVPMFMQMDKDYAAGIDAAMRHPMVAINNLKNSWTEFLTLVGQSGLMESLGRAAHTISQVMDSAEFRDRSVAIAKALGDAIINVGNAAAFLLENLETVGKVVAAVLGARAIMTVTSLSVAIGAMAGQFGLLSGAAANAMGFTKVFAGAVGVVRGAAVAVGGLVTLVGGLGRAFMSLGAVLPSVLGLLAGFGRAAVGIGVAVKGMVQAIALVSTTLVAMGRGVATMTSLGAAALATGRVIATAFAGGVAAMRGFGAAVASGAKFVSAIVPTIKALGAAFLGVGKMVAGVAVGFKGLLATGVGIAKGLVTLIKASLFGAFVSLAVVIAENWNEMIKFGDATASVGELVMAFFQQMGEWAQQAGQFIFGVLNDIMGGFASMFGETFKQQTESTQDWALWGQRLVAVVEFTVESIRLTFVALWESLKSLAVAGWDTIMAVFTGGDVGAIWAEFGKKAAMGIQGFVGDSTALVDRIKRDWAELNDDSLFAQFFKNIERGRQEAEAARLAWENRPVDTSAPDVDMTGWDFFPEGEAELGGLGKRAKEAADAIKEFADSQTYLKAQLAAGKISIEQYNELLDHQKKTLEEVVDPYSAMIRSMQEENNLLRLNGKEQRLASAFMQKKNQLLEQGISLTDEQTAALKELIAEQDKLNNPSPLQAWVDGMQEFGDAIESAGVRAMESLSDSLADLIVDGKADWASLAKTILKDLVKIGLNEVWKSMFGGGKGPQQVVNDALSGVKGQEALALAETSSISGMATAVAQGIQIANAGGALGPGGMSGFGTLGNDIGGPFSFADVQALKQGNIDGVGGPLPSWDDFQAMFGPGASSKATSAAVASASKPLPVTISDVTSTAMAGVPGGMPSAFNALSVERATGIHPDLLAVVSNAQKYMPEGRGFQVPPLGGLRTQAEQAALVAKGASKTMNSNHLTGRAIDLMGSPFGQGITQSDINDPARYREIAEAMKKSSAELGVPITWGGDWKNFVDMPHFELPRGYEGSGRNWAAGAAADPMATGSIAGSLPGGMSIASPSAAPMGGGINLQGLGDQVKAEMTPAFQQVATQIPQQFDPAFGQAAQALPQKITDQGDAFGQQLLSAAQPGNMQASQDNAQKYMNANTQAANDFAMKMQQAAGGGVMGGGGGGDVLGGLGGIFGAFFRTGGVVGKSGGSSKGLSVGAGAWSGARSMKIGGIVGDPDAEPIIAHKGELITPAHQVNAMRRMGDDAVLVDNAAVKTSRRRMTGVEEGKTESGSNGSSTTVNPMSARPVINYHITTPNADSFRASQSQIQAKAGAAAYRDARRNH